MSDVSIWHDHESNRDYVSGNGRRVEVDPLVTEAYLKEASLLRSSIEAERRIAVLEGENERLRNELLYVQTHWELDRCPNCEARLDAMVRHDEYLELYRKYVHAVVEGEIWNAQWEAEYADNKRLRELVGRYVKFERDGCKDCPHEDECEATSLYDELCITGRELDSLARELGIEVE